MRINNYLRGAANHAKTRLRIAPYTLRPYAWDAATSIGPGLPTRIVVTGFDPLTPPNQLRHLFTSFGDIREFRIQANPFNGSPLGVCLIHFKDSETLRGGPSTKATDAAKKAYKECNTGVHRVNGKNIRVKLDRDGSLGRRVAQIYVDRQTAELRKHEKPAKSELAKPLVDTSGPPPTAPKGPSGKPSVRPVLQAPPEGPRPLGVKPGLMNLVEERLIVDTIKREPYVFIAHCYVPVLTTTVPHLSKRLRHYNLKEVRCDKTGYFVIFHSTRAGELDAIRCFKECHMTELFTYVMNMECQPYGNPDYERSPSPERIMIEKKQREEQERLAKEAEQDLEVEKQLRALSLDPVIEAIDIIRRELRDKLLEDVRSRITGPALFDFLDPNKHVETRKRHGIENPHDSNRLRVPSERLDEALELTTPGLRPGAASRHGQPAVSLLPRIRKGAQKENLAFTDERRQRRPPRRLDTRGLLHRLHQIHDEEEESDDEHRTSITRDTEEQESRPISRMSMTSDSEVEIPLAKVKTRGRRSNLDWEEESDEEDFVSRTEKSVEPDQDDGVRASARKRKVLIDEVPGRKRLKTDEGRAASIASSLKPSDLDLSAADTQSIAGSVADDKEALQTDADQPKTAKSKAKKKGKKQTLQQQAQMQSALDQVSGRETTEA